MSKTCLEAKVEMLGQVLSKTTKLHSAPGVPGCKCLCVPYFADTPKLRCPRRKVWPLPWKRYWRWLRAPNGFSGL